ncbi:MAG TPA: xanthine dehydrogenase family protein molybdopterin-binding subunit [Gemmatimonadaceae bacterium]|nr:xanthine dehydrogenase family protein molybdopterin-binding subunit [Gemmatimonadaceae bacterium]
MTAVGQSVKRKDGIGKATGRAMYADDLTFPGMLYGRTIRTTIPSGNLIGVRHDYDITGFTIVDQRDIPGRNIVSLIVDDQPCLVENAIQHVAEPVTLLAHEDRDTLLAANVILDCAETPPLFDPRRSDKVLKELLIEKGNLERGFRIADVIVEGTYRTGHQEHVYIETNGVVAVPETAGVPGVTVYGSIQCPFYVDRALRVLLGPEYSVRVVQTETGGGFGGKEEYPSMLACHAALLAIKSGRPVKMIYDRVEDMLATTKRHPSIITHRTGVKRDGRITAMDVQVVIDGGAYVTLSPVVLSRGSIHAAGPYRCTNTRIHGRAMFTNTPPNGAFRGFGAPQTQFAMEVHMERIAEQLGIDPVKLREKNALRPGDLTATGQKLREDCSALRVLKEAVRKSRYRGKVRKYQAQTPDMKKPRGIGVSLFYHGSGFTGSGELKLASRAAVECTERGVRLLVSSTEIGQGTRTMHAQIVADAMGLPYDDVEVAPIDTSIVPDSGPTVASRTTMVVGKILERAAHELRETLGGMHPAEYFATRGPFRVEKQHEPPEWLEWDEERYRGDAYATFAWACDVAEVELDPDTFEVRPVRITAVQDIGKAIHPALATGQIEGGTAQGVGFALIEQVVMKKGAMANAQLTNYTIPTTLDTPTMDVHLVENPFPEGPFGAKGLGELPIDGPAPAIVNAIRSLGIDVREVPATPEVVMLAATAARPEVERLVERLTYGAPVAG